MTRARECDGKQRHASRQAALDHMWNIVARTGAASVQLGVYRCRFCKTWHTGHRKKRRWQV